jgi:predicted signal transduction protein with EAL and GGDEF domain
MNPTHNRCVGHRIEQIVSQGTYLGRFAGDKFALCIPDTDLKQAETLANGIVRPLSKPIIVEDRELFLTASIGISFYPDDTDDTEMILRNADTALNLSKSYGGNKITFFSTGMNEEALERVEMESQLRKAVHSQQFYRFSRTRKPASSEVG